MERQYCKIIETFIDGIEKHSYWIQPSIKVSIIFKTVDEAILFFVIDFNSVK